MNLDLLTYAGSLTNLENLPNPEQHIFVEGDICDADLVDTILQKYAIDTIVHFAAESHVDRSIVGPAAFVKTNLVGTFTLLEAARKYACRFHHISTDEVYGSLSATCPPFTEKTAYAPNSPYSASKAGSDHLVRSYFHTYGLPVVISHCSNNYGPYQHPEKFIPTIIRSCLAFEPIPVYGDGSNIRDWIFVEDHCRGIWEVLKHGKAGETYNLGGDCEMSNLTVANVICQLMDKYFPQKTSHASLIQFVKDRPGHDWRYAIDSKRSKEELGWRPLTDFTHGLQQTINFYSAVK